MMAEFAYTKIRSDFGRQCSFSDRSVEVLANIRPNEELAADYIRRNPVDRGIQISSFEHYSEHYVSLQQFTVVYRPTVSYLLT